MLQERFKKLIEESAGLYTDDGRQAMRQVYDELCQSPWERRAGLLDGKEEDSVDETIENTEKPLSVEHTTSNVQRRMN